MSAPLPRFRIYTSPGTYRDVFRGSLGLPAEDQKDTANLERAVCSTVGAAHAASVPQARVGIYLAVRSLIRPGQKVVLSPYTIFDVVNMVICAGGVPVFCDIDRKTCNIDPARAAELIDGDTGAVLVTHLHGLAVELRELAEVCASQSVALIEDAAQAFGTRLDGQMVGTFGDAGIYSFGMYKNVNSFYGGMVVSPHAEVRQRIVEEVASWPFMERHVLLSKSLSGLLTDIVTWPPLFRSVTHRLFRYGYLNDVEFLNKRVRVEDNPHIKRRLPESYQRRLRPVQARLARGQLGAVDRMSRERVEFARMYDEGLRDLADLIVPDFRDDLSHVYTYYPVQCDDRDGLLRHLMRNHRDVAAQHYKNCADLECFFEYRAECPNTAATARSLILLPTYPRYGRRDVEANIEHIRAYFGARREPA